MAVKPQQFNVYLPPDLVREIKHAVIDDGGTLSSVTADAFRLYLQHREAGGQNADYADRVQH